MNAPAAESKVIDSFKMHVAGIESADLEQLHALSVSVGWPLRSEDLQFLRECGHGYVARDEIGRLTGSAMWFPHGDDFATIGMVITSPRLQTNGAGRWLMDHVLSDCQGRDLRLNATRAARRLYHSLGFQPVRTIYQCQGIARHPIDVITPSEQPVVRRLKEEDLVAVVELDAGAFGVSRAALIGKLFAQSIGYGLFRGGRLYAFALCRPFGRGHVIGPVVAETDADAIAVIRQHVAAHENQFLRLDTPVETGTFATFLSQSGLTVFDTVLAMSRRGKGRADVVPGSNLYGLASHALG
ncbi:putative GNAT family N-acyltransferase [Sinorhizobium terangae]|uniref:GNAT family N-acetyltransferase n=1 Tax=Sinorhizobium terangae TaxID=110322 RepID=A0A6N7LG48_SINTE|nr:GNAT family N-acetyltransferase [Sinorhizobium terangae]MBB4186266.1 putative GNAT family N-acyltransferase [Sinorhizobium terangae]MQX15875.1 GNAT family N-acetyltransferase [Sinorhizobium terangae]